MPLLQAGLRGGGTPEGSSGEGGLQAVRWWAPCGTPIPPQTGADSTPMDFEGCKKCVCGGGGGERDTHTHIHTTQ